MTEGKGEAAGFVAATQAMTAFVDRRSFACAALSEAANMTRQLHPAHMGHVSRLQHLRETSCKSSNVRFQSGTTGAIKVH
ncbi:MAG: hypothetical protein AB7O76_03970 [Rhizobiaceae bacterium]